MARGAFPVVLSVEKVPADPTVNGLVLNLKSLKIPDACFGSLAGVLDEDELGAVPKCN